MTFWPKFFFIESLYFVVPYAFNMIRFCKIKRNGFSFSCAFFIFQFFENFALSLYAIKVTKKLRYNPIFSNFSAVAVIKNVFITKKSWKREELGRYVLFR